MVTMPSMVVAVSLWREEGQIRQLLSQEGRQDSRSAGQPADHSPADQQISNFSHVYLASITLS